MKDFSSLHFNHQFLQSFEWNKTKLRLGAVLPANKNQISKGLKDLSSESIRNRFLGSKKEFSAVELEYLTNLDGWNHWAFGIEEVERPFRGIGIARLVRSSEKPQEAEMAITIIDEYQGQGLGTILINLIALAASEREISRLTFTSLPQNSNIHKLIQKIGAPQMGESEMDYVQLYLDMKTVNLEKIKSQLRPILPSIDTFGSRT